MFRGRSLSSSTRAPASITGDSERARVAAVSAANGSTAKGMAGSPLVV